jgi:hypothetical protein
MTVRGLIEREAASQFKLTDQGRAVLAAMLVKVDDPTARSAFGGGPENICSVGGFSQFDPIRTCVDLHQKGAA